MSPDAGVTSVRASRVSVLRRVTVAPGTGCPDESRTRPVIVPLELCANSVPANSPAHKAVARIGRKALVMAPPACSSCLFLLEGGAGEGRPAHIRHRLLWPGPGR